MSKTLGKWIESSVALAGSPTSTTQAANDNSTKLATTAYVFSAIGGLGDVLSLQGALDASAIGAQLDDCQKGYYYRVTVAGTLFGTNSIVLAVGDALICITDQSGTPTDGANFFKVDNTELDDQTALEVTVTGAYDSSTATGNVAAGSDSVESGLEKVEKKADDNATNITANDGDITDIRSSVGISDGDTDMGTFTGSTISDAGTAKAGMQELETEVELKAASSVVTEIDANVDDLISLSGVAENASDLGTFTGTTIADASSNKVAMQALETAVEAAASSGNTPEKDEFTLDGTDLTNNYIDLSAVAKAKSIAVLPVGGPEQDEGVDYTVSLTGGAGGFTRITFAGDLLANKAVSDKIVVKYQS